MNDWDTAMPLDPGWYWYYGQQFKTSAPRLHTVNVWDTRTGVVWVCDGSFMYPGEKGKGLFMKIEEPPMPALDDVLKALEG